MRREEGTTPLFGGPDTRGLTRVCRLAEGGMGRVDLAIHRAGDFRRMYAVKRLHPHLASDPEFRGMFLDEARIAGRLRHPNVVGVLDVGEDEQGPYLVMDYVDGLPLSNLIRLSRATGEPMPVQIALRLSLDIVRGLHAAHELAIDGRPLGLVHRDLSPQNVLVGFDGVARITDFGIAKALGRSTRTATGVLKGKLAYMSPEQILAEPPDRRSDLFSFGVVLFEMLSGRRLHARATAAQIVDAAPPDIGELRADVPDELVQLSFELLARRREARPHDAREVARRLDTIYAGLLAEEEPADVADYVELVAGAARREQERTLAEAMEEAERSMEHRAAPRRGRRWLLVAGVLLCGAVAAGAVALWPEDDAGARAEPVATPPSGAASRVAPSGAASRVAPSGAASSAAPSTDAGGDAAAAVVATRGGSDAGPAAAEAGEAAEASSTPRRAVRRRRAPRRSMRRPPTMMDDERLPDWVDFEQ